MAHPTQAYLATQVETTTQGELLIMLYEAAIKFLKRAQMEIDNKDYAKKGIYLSKAMAIIHELAECLNKEKGGEITPKLASLYQFCTSQLIKANIRMDKKMVEEVIRILDGLRSAYAQIVPEHEGKVASSGDKATIAQAPPAAPAPQQETAPSKTPAPPTTSPVQPAPAQPLATKPAAQEAPKAPVKPAPAQTPTPPPKIRTAANAAKMRAANAYTNANR